MTSLDPRTAELGLLAVAGERTGSGVGRALMAFAHDLARERGHTAMRLTLLVPQEGSHPFKVRLDDWYRRQGYRIVGRADFAATHPEPAAFLVVACDLVSFERPWLGDRLGARARARGAARRSTAASRAGSPARRGLPRRQRGALVSQDDTYRPSFAPR